MRINTLFLDLDGTILTSTKKISSNSYEALKKFTDNGGNIIIATGRQYDACKKYKNMIQDFTGHEIEYTINLNGAYIKDANGEFLYKDNLSGDLVKSLIEIATKLKIKFLIYPSNPEYKEHTFTNSIWAKLTNNFAQRNSSIEYTDYTDFSAFKLNFISFNHKKLMKLQNKLTKLYVDQIAVVFSTKYLLEVTHIASTKGNAIKFLIERLKLNPKKCAVIGDSQNDVSAFKILKTSCALTNDININKFAAFTYQKRNGVAKFINDRILNFKPKKIKMIVSDLDGTLYNKDKTIDPKTIETIAKAYGKYKIPYFCLATGRALLASYAVIQELNIPHRGIYLISNNGSIIFDLQHKKTLNFTGIDEKTSKIIIELIHKFNSNKTNIIGIIHNWDETKSIMGILSNGEIYSDDYSFDPNKFIKMLGSISKGFFTRFNRAERIKPIENIEGNYHVSKFVLYFPDLKQIPIFKEKLQALHLPVDITTSGKGNMEILPINVNKGTSLNKLLKMLHIDKEEVLSIGDEENDIPILKITPWSYTFECSKPNVKAMATYVLNYPASTIVKEAINHYTKASLKENEH